MPMIMGTSIPNVIVLEHFVFKEIDYPTPQFRYRTRAIPDVWWTVEEAFRNNRARELDVEIDWEFTRSESRESPQGFIPSEEIGTVGTLKDGSKIELLIVRQELDHKQTPCPYETSEYSMPFVRTTFRVSIPIG